MSYSQALEMQYTAARWIQSDAAAEWFSACNEVAASEAGGKQHAWDAGEITRRFAGPLFDGDVFYWSPEICDMLATCSKSVPEMTMTADLLPSVNGFVWFGKPMFDGMDDGAEYPPDLQAITWTVLGGPGAETVAISPWFKNLFCPVGLPVGGVCWDFGERANALGGYDGLINDEARTGVAWFLNLFGAMLLFMNQRILVTQPERPERAVRRRLARNGWAHDRLVNVVQLRRAEHQSVERGQSGEPVEWTCQWVVSGHWRQQACGPNRSERRPVFVLPYVKGPTDKPLKAPAERVFAVVR